MKTLSSLLPIQGVLAALIVLAIPCSADLFSVAGKINENIYTCDWLYRDVHEWARENGSPRAFLASQKAIDVATIEANIETIDLAIKEAEDEATPVTFAATAAFAEAQRAVCRSVLNPGAAWRATPLLSSGS